MNPCDCKRPESQGSSWRRGGVLVAFPFLADPFNGEKGSVPIQNLANERNVPECQAPTRPDSGPEHSLSSLVSRLSRRLSSVVCLASNSVCRLCAAEKRWRINWGPRK